MAVALRLARGGAKKRPYYRIVATDRRNARDGRFIEKIGTYNPMLAKEDPKRVILLEDRVKHWLSVGAQPSERVHGFLHKAGILEAPFTDAARPQKPRRKPSKKSRAEIRAENEVKAKEEAEAAAKAEAEAAAAAKEEAAKPETAAAGEEAASGEEVQS